jgi:hypothetical protein
VTVRGEKPWPHAGRNHGRTRGTPTATHGDKPMAIDTLAVLTLLVQSIIGNGVRRLAAKAF